MSTSHFFVTHYGGCAVFFNKDIFHSDIKVTSVYLHDTRDGQQHVVKRQSGWALQAVISRASFRRLPRNGKSFFTMTSLHVNNKFAKKRGLRKLLLTVRTVMLEEHVDMVAGDFNGAAWRGPCGSDRRLTSIIEEASDSTNLPVPPGPTPLWVNRPMCVD